MILYDIYHRLYYRCSLDTVEARSEGNEWKPFYDGKGKWIIADDDVTHNSKSILPDTNCFCVLESKLDGTRVLELGNGIATRHTNVQLGAFSNQNHQHFKFIPAGPGSYFIENKLTPGLGLDSGFWGTEDQANMGIDLRETVKTATSKFKVIDAGDGYVRLVSLLGDNYHIGVADDNRNIVSRNKNMGERTLFKLNKVTQTQKPE